MGSRLVELMEEERRAADLAQYEQENPEAMPRQIYDEPGYRPYRAAPAYAHRQVQAEKKVRIKASIFMAVMALLIAVAIPTFERWWLSR